MRRIFFLLGLAVITTGCTGTQGEAVMGMPGSPAWFASASPETIAGYYSRQCASYGFMAGTPGMAQCIQNSALSGRQTASNRVTAASGVLMQPRPQPSPMRTTNCRRVGSIARPSECQLVEKRLSQFVNLEQAMRPTLLEHSLKKESKKTRQSISDYHVFSMLWRK
jgi:hypothetical protein